MDGCRRRRGSRTCSQTSPGLTAGHDQSSSDHFAHQDLPMTESVPTVPTEWTDEKHSLYLKSMEASFVTQLYNSADLLGWRSQKDIPSANLSEQAPSGQFKVLRHGCWQRIDFQRSGSQPNAPNGQQVLLTNPWIQHFRSARKTQGIPSPALRESAHRETAASETQSLSLNGMKAMSGGSGTIHSHPCQSYTCHHDLIDGNTEVSDQNFIDEDTEGEKASSACSSKRMKTLKIHALGSDQVVPFGKPPLAEDVAGRYISASR